MIININVADKVAKVVGAPVIICGNSDYKVTFTFDAEWTDIGVKTARFVYRREGAVKYEDVVFSRNQVSVPVLSNIDEVLVGVYAGDLRTTTPARIVCKKSILCTDAEQHEEPSEDVYNQLVQVINDIEGLDFTQLTVEAATLDAGSEATGAIAGTVEAPVLKLGVPRGEQGPQGEQGERGPKGDPGANDAGGVIYYTPNMMTGLTYNSALRPDEQFIYSSLVEWVSYSRAPEAGDYLVAQDFTNEGVFAFFKIDSIGNDSEGVERYLCTRITQMTGTKGDPGANDAGGVIYYTPNMMAGYTNWTDLGSDAQLIAASNVDSSTYARAPEAGDYLIAQSFTEPGVSAFFKIDEIKANVTGVVCYYCTRVTRLTGVTGGITYYTPSMMSGFTDYLTTGYDKQYLNANEIDSSGYTRGPQVNDYIIAQIFTRNNVFALFKIDSVGQAPESSYEGSCYYCTMLTQMTGTKGADGEGLPSVTSADSGKFLRVNASGVWVAESIPSAEGVEF